MQVNLIMQHYLKTTQYFHLVTHSMQNPVFWWCMIHPHNSVPSCSLYAIGELPEMSLQGQLKHQTLKHRATTHAAVFEVGWGES